jgi:hypothetical protein
MVSGNGMLASADRIDHSKGHDVRGNIRLVFVAANIARNASSVEQNKAQLAQIRAAYPPFHSFALVPSFECEECGEGGVACTFVPSTCDACYLTIRQNRSNVTRLLGQNDGTFSPPQSLRAQGEGAGGEGVRRASAKSWEARAREACVIFYRIIKKQPDYEYTRSYHGHDEQ